MSSFTIDDRVWVVENASSGMESGSFRTEDRFKCAGSWGTIASAHPDSDGDYMVIADDDPEEFYYVHKNYLRTQEVKEIVKEGIVKEQAVSDVQPGVWVAYYDGEYSGNVVTAWASEIDALRYAVQNSAAVKYLTYGEELVP